MLTSLGVLIRGVDGGLEPNRLVFDSVLALWLRLTPLKARGSIYVRGSTFAIFERVTKLTRGSVLVRGSVTEVLEIYDVQSLVLGKLLLS